MNNPVFCVATVLICFTVIKSPLAAQNRIVIVGDESKAKEVVIDELFELGNLWKQTPDGIEAAWKDKGFKWASGQTKDRGTIRRENWGFEPLKLKAFENLVVEEIVFIFKDGKLAELSLLPWNKGDSQESDISEEDFNGIVRAWTAELDKRIAPNHQNRGRDTASAARAERRMWVGKETLAQLEYSGGKERVRDYYSGRTRSGPNFQGEFIRLRLMPKPESMVGLDASTGGSVSAKRADLGKSVVRDDSGDVFIPDVPMVDQGDKGYCAVATAARLLNYYGVAADQHEMAQIAGSQAGGGGTNPDEMEDALKKISGKFKTRFVTLLDLDYTSRKYQRFMRRYNVAARKLGKKVLDTDRYIYFLNGLNPEVLREVNGQGQVYERFMGSVKENIDKGIPLMWALQLGLFPENGQQARQFGGGHMRLIIGYNEVKEEIIFSDSWGAGHEIKRMAAPDASAATMGLYLLQPAR
jgi:hypothetical protein